MTTAQLVVVIAAVFGANGAFSQWILSRAQRRSNDLDNKTAANGQAIDGFSDLVKDLQAQHREDVAEITRLKDELAACNKQHRKGQQ